MTDMDVFLLLTLNRKELPSVSDEAIRQLLTTTFGIPVSLQDMEQFRQQFPTTKQLVHALSDRGYSPSHIKDYLLISQPTVSYHLSTTPSQPYFNRFWSNLRRSWAENLRKHTTDPD